jgi:4-amino-4-deoxy-L-arabinose transferase-like glycosyltransferase
VHSVADSRTRRFAIVATGALAFAFAYLIQNAGDNERAHYALVRALADGTPTIDESLRHPALRTIDVSRFEGSAYAAKAPGLAAASVPPYLALETAGADTTGDPDRVVWGLHLWGVVLPALAMLVLVLRFADRVQPRYGTIAAVTLGAATLVLPFSTVFFSHILSAALGFLAFVFVDREREQGPRPLLAGAAGLAAGLAVTVEYPLGLVAVALATSFLAGSRRVHRALAYAAGVAAGVAPILLFGAWAFRAPFQLSYEGWHEPGSKPLPGVFGITFPSLDVLLKILFFPGGVAPILVPAIIGAIVLWRRGDRWVAGIPMLVAALFLVYDSANTTPFGGASPGPRYLIPMLPFLAVPLAAAWRAVPGLAAGLAVPAAAFMAGATLTSPLGAWDQEVLHRLATGGYVDSAAAFLGVHGGVGALPFAAALAVAAGAAALATPRPQRVSREAGAALLAAGGWVVLMTQTPRLLSDGAGGQLVVVAVALATAAAVTAAYRASFAVRVSPAASSHPTGTEP